jgi:hypothetical protein
MNDKGLRLLAHDAEDLKVVSAAVQDAIARVGDFAFDPRARAFTAVVNRYRWEAGRKERVRTALRFDCVLSVKSAGVRKDAPDAVVELLAIEFEPGPGEENPGGWVRLILAGGGEIRMEAEHIEARLMDVGAPWPARRQPGHEKS